MHEGEREMMMNKNKLFTFDFLKFEEHEQISGSKFRNTVVKFFVYKLFSSLWCGCHGAAPIPNVQDAILNLPHPCLHVQSINIKILIR